MSNFAILDCVLGDTGKGRVAHYFSKTSDWVVRTGGANNCGHVIYRNGKKYNHHFLPSADYLNPRVKSFLASGMYLHLPALLQEIELMEKDFAGVAKTIYIDPDAFIITDQHIKTDQETNKHLGTTGKGVGIAAAAKYARRSPRVYNFINDNAEIIKAFKKIGVHFRPLLSLKEEFERSSIVFEGHQGVLLDINAGITPYTTSSDCTVAGIYAAGFNFIKLDRVYGLTKGGYLTKSGEGPLPTEMPSDEAARLRALGNEIGNSTGRNRRIAYMDLPMLKYGVRKGGITHLIMTKLDILNGMKNIKVCYDYGKEIFSPNDFNKITPFYINLPGWQDAKDFQQVESFVRKIEEYLGIPVEYISVGVEDEDMVRVPDSVNREGAQNSSSSNLRFLDPFETPSETSGFIKYGAELSNLTPNYKKSISDQTTKSFWTKAFDLFRN